MRPLDQPPAYSWVTSEIDHVTQGFSQLGLENLQEQGYHGFVFLLLPLGRGNYLVLHMTIHEQEVKMAEDGSTS